MWPFKNKASDPNKQASAKDQGLAGETHFLARLARVKCLSTERPELDGAALVIEIRHQECVCEALVEVRLAGSTDELGRTQPTTQGRLKVFLQNASNEPVRLRGPEFLLTGGLKLPWKPGIVMMMNIYRGEMGEALSWQVAITGNEAPELLASEIVAILSLLNNPVVRIAKCGVKMGKVRRNSLPGKVKVPTAKRS